jgi:hypothetical protein
MTDNCLPDFLLRRLAYHAGVPESDLLSAVVRTQGNTWCVDLSHSAMQSIAAWRPDFRRLATTKGPGTELKKLLKAIGLTASASCDCNARAKTMDKNGAEWCQDNIETIVGWLREEAAKRGLPFVDVAGRLLVKRAIANARKAAGK